MDAQLSSFDEVVQVVGIAAALGVAGGLANALAEPVKRLRARREESEVPEEGLLTATENRLVLPAAFRVGKGRLMLDAGFLGPMLIGAVAAAATVFALGVTRPAEPTSVDVGKAVGALRDAKVPEATLASVRSRLSEPKPAFIEWEKLVWLSLIGGFAGSALLQAARARLIDAIGAAKAEGRAEGAHRAKRVADQAENVEEAREKVAAEAEQLANSTPFGNPAFE